jgi:hypothetical protein
MAGSIQQEKQGITTRFNGSQESLAAAGGWKCSWGFLLALLLAAGCQGGDVATSALVGGGSAQNEMRAVHSQSSGEAPTLVPVRVSRALFEKEMKAEVRLRDASGRLVDELGSAVEWVEYPPTAPAPSPDAIADFRDRDGCAWLSQEADSPERQPGVCFRLMGDVSSVGLNDREMRLENMIEWAQARAPGIQSLALVQATRDSSGFRATFDATDDRGEHYSLEVALHPALGN